MLNLQWQTNDSNNYTAKYGEYELFIKTSRYNGGYGFKMLTIFYKDSNTPIASTIVPPQKEDDNDVKLLNFATKQFELLLTMW